MLYMKPSFGVEGVLAYRFLISLPTSEESRISKSKLQVLEANMLT